MIRLWGWNDWYIHPFTLLYLVMAYFGGHFFEYVMALALVCFHEMFHYVFARIYHFKIIDVQVLPFGAFLNLEDYGLHHVVEELVTIMAGLCSHFFLYFIIMALGGSPYLLATNRLIFIFNVLPIYPLDGSKILLLLLSFLMDYQKAITLQIKISIFALSVLMVYQLSISYYVIYGYLLYLNYLYIKEYRIQVIRLVLSRGQTKLYHKNKLHTKLSFYRPYDNFYQINGHMYSEKQMTSQIIKRLKNN